MMAFSSKITASSLVKSSPKTNTTRRSTIRIHSQLLPTTRKSTVSTIPRASSESNSDLDALPEPDDARGAIAIGLKLTESKQWESAQQYFERALDLPGTGLKRYRDKPRQLSDGERISAMYNIACCQSQFDQPENIQNGLMAIAGCLEAGYDNFQQLRTDPDLENIRKHEKFEGLIQRFEKKKSGFMGLFKSY